MFLEGEVECNGNMSGFFYESTNNFIEEAEQFIIQRMFVSIIQTKSFLCHSNHITVDLK